MSSPDTASYARTRPSSDAQFKHAVARLRKGALNPEPIIAAVQKQYPYVGPDAVLRLRIALATALTKTFGPIFPLQPDAKTPIPGSHAHHDASSDPQKIRQWCLDYGNVNWGRPERAIDVDTKEAHNRDGLAEWRRILAEHNGGNEPATLRVKTPTGGLHYHVVSPLPKCDLAPGVESPNYVVLPGSHVPAGFYVYDNDLPITDLPFVTDLIGATQEAERGDNGAPACELDTDAAIAAATELLKMYAGSPVTRNAVGKQTNGPAIEGDHGDDWTVQVAMNVGDLGISCDVCFELMRDFFNDACVPPWPLEGQQSLRHKVESAYKSRQSPLGRDNPQADFAGDEPTEPPGGFGGDGSTQPPPNEKAAKDSKRRNRLKGRTLTELRNLKEPVWIVIAMVPDGLVVVYGKPKRGKSFYALDLSLCVATGHDFHGEKIGKTGKVLYVAAEGGAAAVRNRVLAWCKARGVDPDTVINWELVDTGIALNDANSVNEFLAVNSGKYALIVLDTLARNTRGDENSAKDMSAAIKGCDLIRDMSGAAVVLVHHEGWSAARLRGSSVLQGAPDAVIRVARDKDDYTTVVAEDMRESAAGKTQVFKLGTDGVLHIVAAADAAHRATGDRVLDILADLEGEHGGPVPVAVWRDAVKAAGLIDPEKAGHRAAWKRMLDAMVLAKRVKQHKGDRYTLNVRRDDLADDAPITDFADDPIDDDADFE